MTIREADIIRSLWYNINTSWEVFEATLDKLIKKKKTIPK